MAKGKSYFLAFICLAVFFSSCTKEGGINFFTIEQDRQFGEQMDSLIKSSPGEYPVLARSTNTEAYRYADALLNHILASNEILYRHEFDWEITLIDDDVLNAFACPGGKLYFYTGIIDYLDNGSQLAGVMAHEVAHADRRHSTHQLTKQYGLSLLLSILVGDDASYIAQIAGDLATGLAGLAFSRNDEYEADEYSVRYLADGDELFPKGIAGFFEKINSDGHTSSTFEFLSTHPNDDNRLENINNIYNSLSDKGAPSTASGEDEYNRFKIALGL